MRKNNLAFLALVLMVLLPSLLIVKALYDRQNGTVWQVSITGYDPRDILRGHYLNFRYDWALAEEDAVNICLYGAKCCLCLTETAPGNFTDPAAKRIDCRSDEARQCSAKVKGRDLFTGPQVYYIPEKYAPDLERKLQGGQHDFKMEIAVPRSGGPAIIRDLYLDGKPLGDSLKTAP